MKLYKVTRDYSGKIKLESIEVKPWGQGYKAIDSSRIGLGFKCRTTFTKGEHAESESEAWSRFKDVCEKTIVGANRHIVESQEGIEQANDRLRDLHGEVED